MVVRGESDFVRGVGEKDIGVVGIGGDGVENLWVGLRVGMGEMGDWCDEGEMRRGGMDDGEFWLDVLREGKVVGNVERGGVVRGIGVRGWYSGG